MPVLDISTLKKQEDAKQDSSDPPEELPPVGKAEEKQEPEKPAQETKPEEKREETGTAPPKESKEETEEKPAQTQKPEETTEQEPEEKEKPVQEKEPEEPYKKPEENKQIPKKEEKTQELFPNASDPKDVQEKPKEEETEKTTEEKPVQEKEPEKPEEKVKEEATTEEKKEIKEEKKEDEETINPLSSDSERRLIEEDNLTELFGRGYNEKEIQYMTGTPYDQVLTTVAKNMSFFLKIRHFLNKHYGGFNFSLGMISIICLILVFISVPTAVYFFQLKTNAEVNAENLILSQYYFGEGVGYYNSNDFEKAITAFDKALMGQPLNVEIHFYKANSYFELDKLDRAQEIYSHITMIDEGNKRAYVKRAITLAAQEKWGEAMESIDAALAIDSHYDYAHYHSCPILEKVGRFDEAKECFFKFGRETEEGKV